MKTFIILCLFSISSILYAQDSDKGKIEKTEEFTTYRIDNIQKRAKVVYLFNSEGQRTERIVYSRDNMIDWTPVQMHSYQYNEQGKVADIVYTKWNTESKCWNDTSEHLIHIYDYTGKLLSIQKCEKDTYSNLAHN